MFCTVAYNELKVWLQMCYCGKPPRIDVGFNFLLSPRLPLASETIQAFNEKHPPPSSRLNCHGEIMKHTKHQETNKPHISFDINMKSYENNTCEKRLAVMPPPYCISKRDGEERKLQYGDGPVLSLK